MKNILLAALLLFSALAPFQALAAGENEADRMGHIKTLIAERGQAERAAQAGTEQFARTQSETVSGGMRAVQALMLCTAVFLIGVFLYRKATGAKPMARSRRMRVLERLTLAPKTSLVIAEVNGREVLLAVGEKVSIMDLHGTEEYQQEMELLCQDDSDERRLAAS